MIEVLDKLLSNMNGLSHRLLLAMEQRDGSIAWRQDALQRRSLSDPLAYSNYIFVGDAEGYLHVVAQSDGRLLARRRIDNSSIQKALVQEDGTVYLQARSGNLFAVELTRNQ